MKVTTAERLKEIMKKRGLRQADVLRMAEPYSRTFGIPLNRANLSMYVTGKVVPVQDKLFLLARTLDVSEAWLMGLDVPEASEPEAKNLANSVVDLMQLNGDDQVLLAEVMRNPQTKARLLSYAEKLRATQKGEESEE